MTREEVKVAVLRFVEQVDYDIAKELEHPEMEELEDRLDGLVDLAVDLFGLNDD